MVEGGHNEEQIRMLHARERWRESETNRERERNRWREREEREEKQRDEGKRVVWSIYGELSLRHWLKEDDHYPSCIRALISESHAAPYSDEIQTWWEKRNQTDDKCLIELKVVNTY